MYDTLTMTSTTEYSSKSILDDGYIEIFVKMICGDIATFVFDGETTLVDDVRKEVGLKLGMTNENEINRSVRLVYCGKQLDNGRTLKSHQIENASTIYQCHILRGD